MASTSDDALTHARDRSLMTWSYHQSYDQATVLFLVHKSVSSRDLDITIGSDYIVAAVRSQGQVVEPIKARLFGHINTATSTWRIGDKGRSRSKRPSRSLHRAPHQSQSVATQRSAEGSTGARSGDGLPSARDSRPGRSQQAVCDEGSRALGAPAAARSHRSDRADNSPPPASSPRSYGSLEASTASLRSGSSYEVLQAHSGGPSRASRQALSVGTGWSSGSSEVDSHDDVMAISTVLSEPDGLGSARSEFDLAHHRPRRIRSDLEVSMASTAARDDAESDMVSSVLSSAPTRGSANSDALVSESEDVSSGAANDAMSDPSSSSPSRPTTEASVVLGQGSGRSRDDLEHPAVRLVTIHLDKIDTGIWPLLVVGPAPLRMEGFDSSTAASGIVRELSAPLQMPAGTESFIASRLRSAVRERSDRRTRQNAERQLAIALGEALNTSQSSRRDDERLDDSRATVQAYLEGLAASMPDPSEDQEDAEDYDDDDDAMRPSTSRLSIASNASDDSTTVLGSRTDSTNGPARPGHERGTTGAGEESRRDMSTSDDDEVERLIELQTEAKYNMDPTTLSLIGLQVAGARRRAGPDSCGDAARGGDRTSPTSHGLPEAFEYFARAWRTGDIALATERLVEDYLPPLATSSSMLGSLPPSGSAGLALPKVADMARQGSADTFRPGATPGDASSGPSAQSSIVRTKLAADAQRQRLIASLGGTRALARLYLSYARLQLPSYAKLRSPLAFPLGQLNSPFVAGPDARRQAATALKRKSSLVLSSPASSRASSAAPSQHSGGPAMAASPSHRARVPSVDSASPLLSPALSTGRHAPRNEADDHLDFFAADVGTAAVLPGPLQFLVEAIRLDDSVRDQITEVEWTEAAELDEAEARRKSVERHGIEQAEEMGSLAGESLSGDLVFDSDSEAAGAAATAALRRDRHSTRTGSQRGGSRRSRTVNDGSSTLLGSLGRIFGAAGGDSGNGGDGDSATAERTTTRKAQRKTGPNRVPKGGEASSSTTLAYSIESSASREGQKRRKGSRHPPHHHHHHRQHRRASTADPEAGMLAFVSGAALLSVALAGGVAAVGWWRRASGALPSST